MSSLLPLFAQDQKTKTILKNVIAAIPPKTRAYLVGGVVRNAIYYHLFKEKLPFRDYDLLVLGDIKSVVKNLRQQGFVYGKIRRKNMLTLKKKLIPHPQHEYHDYFYFDIKHYPAGTILQNLRTQANFTINGFALPLQYAVSPEWKDHIISLPRAWKDLAKKQLRVNALTHPANLYACIRFMHLGFKAPSKTEINELLRLSSTFEAWRHPRNIKKIYSYVGGEKNARKIAHKLGISMDIFDLKVLQSLKHRKR